MHRYLAHYRLLKEKHEDYTQVEEQDESRLEEKSLAQCMNLAS